MAKYKESCLTCINNSICIIPNAISYAIGGAAGYINFASKPVDLKGRIKKKLGRGEVKLLIEDEDEVYSSIGRNCQLYHELPARTRLRGEN